MNVTALILKLNRVLRVAVKNKVISLPNSDFDPIPSITRDDADIAIIFLSGNGVLYSNPVSDDWYQVSTTPVNSFVGQVVDIIQWPTYRPLEPASPLGCAIQHQFCDSALGSSGCGPLTSLRDAVAGVAGFFGTNYTESTAERMNGTTTEETAARLNYLVWMFFGFNKSITEVFHQLGSMALLSRQTLTSGQQGPLAPDQWKRDISNAWNISLAMIQGSMVDTAYGPSDPNYLQSWVNFSSPSLKKLCNSQVCVLITHVLSLITILKKILQKILSTAYGSFSLFGLYFIFIGGALLMLVSYLLEPVSLFLCKRGHRQYAHLEWTTNNFMQLQRLVHEELGLGTWSQCADLIPTTKSAEVLGSLDIADIQHPVISLAQKQQSAGSCERHTSAEPQGSTDLAVEAGTDSLTTLEPEESLPGIAMEPVTPRDGPAAVVYERMSAEDGQADNGHDLRPAGEAEQLQNGAEISPGHPFKTVEHEPISQCGKPPMEPAGGI